MTRYELFRKRIAPVLFLGVVGLIMYDAWKKEEDAAIEGTVVLQLGEAEPHVREIEAEMFVRGESVSTFRRAALPGRGIGACRFQARMPAPDGELRLAVDLGGARKRFTRGVHLRDGGLVTLDLSRELAAPAPASVDLGAAPR